MREIYYIMKIMFFITAMRVYKFAPSNHPKSIPEPGVPGKTQSL